MAAACQGFPPRESTLDAAAALHAGDAPVPDDVVGMAGGATAVVYKGGPGKENRRTVGGMQKADAGADVVAEDQVPAVQDPSIVEKARIRARHDN